MCQYYCLPEYTQVNWLTCLNSDIMTSLHCSMCTWMIDEFGSHDQRQRYVPPLCSMASLSSYCLTEPDAGSDAGNIQTLALRKDDHYVLSGTKVHQNVWHFIQTCVSYCMVTRVQIRGHSLRIWTIYWP